MPVDAVGLAPGEEGRHSPGVGTDRVRRARGGVQAGEELGGLLVGDEAGVDHYPPFGTAGGRYRTLGTKPLGGSSAQVGHHRGRTPFRPAGQAT